MHFRHTSLQTPSSPDIRRAISNGSENVDGDTPFKPYIFVVGLAVILVFVVGWKLKEIMARRLRVREGVTETGSPSFEEEYVPRLWDVWVDRISRKQETCSLREVQPLSVIPSQPISVNLLPITESPARCASRIAHNHNPMGSSSLRNCPRSPRASESDPVHLRVSVIIAMPSPRSVGHAHLSTAVGNTEAMHTRSRERSIPDTLERDDFDFMIGVAHIPLV